MALAYWHEPAWLMDRLLFQDRVTRCNIGLVASFSSCVVVLPFSFLFFFFYLLLLFIFFCPLFALISCASESALLHATFFILRVYHRRFFLWRFSSFTLAKTTIAMVFSLITTKFVWKWKKGHTLIHQSNVRSMKKAFDSIFFLFFFFFFSDKEKPSSFSFSFHKFCTLASIVLITRGAVGITAREKPWAFVRPVPSDKARLLHTLVLFYRILNVAGCVLLLEKWIFSIEMRRGSMDEERKRKKEEGKKNEIYGDEKSGHESSIAIFFNAKFATSLFYLSFDDSCWHCVAFRQSYFTCDV